MLILFATVCNAQTIVEKSMKSKILGCEKNYCIYLPAGYDEGNAQYPVLYLLHGLTDKHTAWRDRGNVKDIATEIFAKGDAKEIIINTTTGDVKGSLLTDKIFDIDTFAK